MIRQRAVEADKNILGAKFSREAGFDGVLFDLGIKADEEPVPAGLGINQLHFVRLEACPGSTGLWCGLSN
ncbi:MAG: hypothetical protein ONB44_10880 [candidate division KSB1 bacterium]|nr:hypothetical protein [candidate division KSB1 bacterium]